MRERQKGRTQEQAAVKANIKSRKTVARYERLDKLPSELKEPRQYRTRADPFAEDWEQVEQMLSEAPELEAKTLFAWLSEQSPGKYQEGQLRTLQRRVSDWRAWSRAEPPFQPPSPWPTSRPRRWSKWPPASPAAQNVAVPAARARPRAAIHVRPSDVIRAQ